MDITELKPGMRVVFIDERLNCGGPGDRFGAPESDADALAGKEMLIVGVFPNGQPGKTVAVAFKKPVPGGHSCDGLVPHGHGRWVLPEQLYTHEQYIAHAKASAKWVEAQAVTSKMVQDYFDE